MGGEKSKILSSNCLYKCLASSASISRIIACNCTMGCSTGICSCKNLVCFVHKHANAVCKYSVQMPCANGHDINDLEFNDDDVNDYLDENYWTLKLMN